MCINSVDLCVRSPPTTEIVTSNHPITNTGVNLPYLTTPNGVPPFNLIAPTLHYATARLTTPSTTHR